MNFSFLIRITPLIFFSLILNGCYEDYLIINSEFKSAIISDDSSKVFFYHSLNVGQPPKGISRFPDGGTQKSIFGNVSLYSYDISNKQLTKIYDFGIPPFNQALDHIAIQNNKVVFSISPLMGWYWIKKYKSDSTFKKIFDKYAGFLEYDIIEGSTIRFINDGFCPVLSPNEKQIAYLKRDTSGISIWKLNINTNTNSIVKHIDLDSPLLLIKWKDNKSIYYKIRKQVYEINLNNRLSEIVNSEIDFYPHKVPIKKIKELTSEISYKDWGFDLKKDWLKSKEEYINDVIVLNGNLNYRKAILQSISGELNNDDLENILIKMQKFENSLENYEKMEYEIFSKETKELIKSYQH